MKTPDSLYKQIIGLAFGTTILLIVPQVFAHTSDGWNWDLLDFVITGTLIFGTGFTYILITRARTIVGEHMSGGVIHVLLDE